MSEKEAIENMRTLPKETITFILHLWFDNRKEEVICE